MILDLTDFEINNIKVISLAGIGNDHRSRWNCLCHCGKNFVATGTEIKRGRVKSCGCLQRRINGLYRSRLYRIHHCMMSRCYLPKHSSYSRYGGRGISVCEEWHDFMNFYNWAMSNGYDDKLTIDRIDNNGNYEPNNCRWVTRMEQSNNISRNRILEYGGKCMTISEWSRELGIDKNTFYKRIKSGWSVKRAITEPVNSQCSTKMSKVSREVVSC